MTPAMSDRLSTDRRRKLDTCQVAAIVPVRNAGRHLDDCLVALRRANPAPAVIVVVADGEGDGGWRVTQDLGVRIVERAESGGPAAARNEGARHVRADDILLFIDADVVIPSDAVEKVQAAFSDDDMLAAVFGSYDDSPSQPNFYSQYRNLLHHYVHQTGREAASTFWGGFGAIRHAVFRAAGGFDEIYRRPSIEDVEFGYRLTRIGYRVRLCKTMQVRHLKRWTFLRTLKCDLFARAVPWTELICRERRMLNDLNLRHGSRVSVMLACLGTAGFLTGPASQTGMVVTLGAALLLLLLNRPLYRFFHRKRGLTFACRAVAAHWLYYLACGCGFIAGLARYGFRQIVASAAAPAASPSRPHPVR